MGWFRTRRARRRGGGGATGAAAAQVVYNRGNAGEPETLDPHKTSTVHEAHILRDLYEGLVIHDGAGKVEPGRGREARDIRRRHASTASRSANNAKWSNGDPVKAADFVFSFRRIMDPETGAKYANILYPILNAEKVNKGQGASSRTSASRRSTTRRSRSRSSADALLPRAPDPPDRPARASGPRSRSSARTSSSPATWSRTAPTSSPSSCRTRTSSCVKNPNYHDAANVKIDTVNYYPTTDLVRRGAALRGRRARHRRATSRPTRSSSSRRSFGDQVKISALSRHLVLRREHVEGAVRRRARAPGAVDRPSTASSSPRRSGAAPCCRPIRSCRPASAITASPRPPTTRTCRRSTARTRPRSC